MKKIYLLTFLVPLIVACNSELRDLYDTNDHELHVEGSWAHSLGEQNMREATVLLHHSDGTRSKKHLSRPNGASLSVKSGDYDVMVFNGIMESEDATNLDHIHFRGSDRLETFEIYAAEAKPLNRLGRADDEYIASNEMEVFTFAHHRVTLTVSGIY